MSRAGLRARLRGMERRPSLVLQAEVTRVARLVDADEAALLAEAEALAGQFQHHGIATREGQLRYVADQAGCSVEELERELVGLQEVIA